MTYSVIECPICGGPFRGGGHAECARIYEAEERRASDGEDER